MEHGAYKPAADTHHKHSCRFGWDCDLSLREVTLSSSIWLKGWQTVPLCRKLFKSELQWRPENGEQPQIRVSIRPVQPWDEGRFRKKKIEGKQRDQKLEAECSSSQTAKLYDLFLRILTCPPNSSIPSRRRGATQGLPAVNKRLTKYNIFKKSRSLEDSWGLYQKKRKKGKETKGVNSCWGWRFWPTKLWKEFDFRDVCRLRRELQGCRFWGVLTHVGWLTEAFTFKLSLLLVNDLHPYSCW